MRVMPVGLAIDHELVGALGHRELRPLDPGEGLEVPRQTRPEKKCGVGRAVDVQLVLEQILKRDAAQHPGLRERGGQDSGGDSGSPDGGDQPDAAPNTPDAGPRQSDVDERLLDQLERAPTVQQEEAKRKAAQDAEVAAKPILEKGLLIVHTGPGKGKSTAAFGLALRALGRGFRVGVVQFIKGAWSTGERMAIERFGAQAEWRTMGEGFTWETQDRARDVAAASAAWAEAKRMMADPSIRLLVLDELNIALRYDYLPLAEVVAALVERRPGLHVVVTGRNAKPEMIEAADCVTEFALVKHHFAAGVRAQEAIEF